MPASTARVIGNDLTLATGGKVKNCTAGAASGEVMEYDQVRTMVATGGVDNKLLRADGTGGHTTQAAAALGESDAGVLTGSGAGAQGAGTMTAPLGPAAADANVTVTGGGADDTFDYALTDNVLYDLEIITVALDTTATKRMIRKQRVHCYALAGTATILGSGSYEDKQSQDASSVFTSAYGEVTATGANIRVTHKAHAANNIKYSTHVRPISIPDPT